MSVLAIYVAGKTHDYLDVRQIQAIVQSTGHHVTYDWTRTVEVAGADHENGITHEQAREAAERDLNGVLTADLMIALNNPNWCGTLIEVGMALATDVPILFVGQPHQRSVFWASPNLYCISDLHDGGDERLTGILRALAMSNTMDLQDMLEDSSREFGLFVPAVEGRKR